MWNILRTLKIRYLKKRQHKIKNKHTSNPIGKWAKPWQKVSLYREISPGFLGPCVPLSPACPSERPRVLVSCVTLRWFVTQKKKQFIKPSLSLESAHHLSHPLGRNLELGKAVRKDFYKDLRDSEPRNKVMTLTCKIKTNLILFTLPLPSFHYKLRGGKRLFSSITLAPLMKDVLGNWNIIKVILYFFY